MPPSLGAQEGRGGRLAWEARMRLGRAGRGGAGARLADRGLHLVEVRLLVEVRCERLGEQPGQHVREREEEQARDELRAARARQARPERQLLVCCAAVVGAQLRRAAMYF